MLKDSMRIKAKEIEALPAEPEPAPAPDFETDICQEGSPWGYVEETPPTPKQRKTSNIVLVVMALFLLAFIVAMIVTFWVKGSVPDTLIQCTMGAGGLEALLLAGIKVSKVVKGGSDNEEVP